MSDFEKFMITFGVGGIYLLGLLSGFVMRGVLRLTKWEKPSTANVVYACATCGVGEGVRHLDECYRHGVFWHTEEEVKA